MIVIHRSLQQSQKQSVGSAAMVVTAVACSCVLVGCVFDKGLPLTFTSLSLSLALSFVSLSLCVCVLAFCFLSEDA